jgi:hypothetical protein
LAAQVRLSAGVEARRQGLNPSTEALRSTLVSIRSALGLFTRAQLNAWLARNDLDAASLERLVEDLTLSQKICRCWEPGLDTEVLNELRLDGNYDRLAERARIKQHALAAAGVDAIEPTASGLELMALRQWFFEKRLGERIPDDLDAFARDLGFDGTKAFDGALRREWLYLNLVR